MAKGPIDPELELITSLAAELIAPDPAGIEPRRAYEEFDVVSPVSLNPGPPSNYIPEQREGGIGNTVPPPGPPAVAFFNHDIDSPRWWGKGYSVLWSGEVYFPDELPANISPDIYQHVDIWNVTDIGLNPNILRQEPVPFSALTPEFDPNRFNTGES